MGFQRFENVENGYRLSGLRFFDTEKYGGTVFFSKNLIYWTGPPSPEVREVVLAWTQSLLVSVENHPESFVFNKLTNAMFFLSFEKIDYDQHFF